MRKKRRPKNNKYTKHKLLTGCEQIEDIELLFLLTRIKSDAKKQAMIDHLCKGMDTVSAQTFNGVSQPKFSQTLKRLNEVADITGQLLERKLKIHTP
ncbi:MAG: hypothetical protein JKY26_01580 [Pseudomonas sp.]|nr:hypothetical protein [Pseudomonas sp.]